MGRPLLIALLKLFTVLLNSYFLLLESVSKYQSCNMFFKFSTMHPSLGLSSGDIAAITLSVIFSLFLLAIIILMLMGLVNVEKLYTCRGKFSLNSSENCEIWIIIKWQHMSDAVKMLLLCPVSRIRKWFIHFSMLN